MRVFENKVGAVCVYLSTVCGLFLLAGNLASHVASQVAVLVVSYLPESDPSPRALSRVERQIQVAQSFQRPEGAVDKEAVVLTAPALPAGLLAAQLDLAEEADISGLKTPRRIRTASRRAPAKALSAGEIFGRRFGVLTVASR